MTWDTMTKGVSGVWEDVGVSFRERDGEEASVEPEESWRAIVGKDEGDFTRVAELLVNDFQEVWWILRLIREVERVVLEEPVGP